MKIKYYNKNLLYKNYYIIYKFFNAALYAGKKKESIYEP